MTSSLLRVDILSDSQNILSESSPLFPLKSNITFTQTGITGANLSMFKFVKGDSGFVLLHEVDSDLAIEILKMTKGKSKVLIASESIGFTASKCSNVNLENI